MLGDYRNFALASPPGGYDPPAYAEVSARMVADSRDGSAEFRAIVQTFTTALVAAVNGDPSRSEVLSTSEGKLVLFCSAVR